MQVSIQDIVMEIFEGYSLDDLIVLVGQDNAVALADWAAKHFDLDNKNFPFADEIPF